jgi:hypothetical protein
LAAVLVAFGAGMLLSAVLADLKDSAVESAQQVKDTAAQSADRVAAEGRSSAETVKDDATPTG